MNKLDGRCSDSSTLPLAATIGSSNFCSFSYSIYIVSDAIYASTANRSLWSDFELGFVVVSRESCIDHESTRASLRNRWQQEVNFLRENSMHMSADQYKPVPSIKCMSDHYPEWCQVAGNSLHDLPTEKTASLQAKSMQEILAAIPSLKTRQICFLIFFVNKLCSKFL